MEVDKNQDKKNMSLGDLVKQDKKEAKANRGNSNGP